MDELSRSSSPLPNESHITLLRACCKRKAPLLHAKHILAHMLLHRVDMDAYMGLSMVKALATCGDVDLAYSVVSNSSFRDASPWTCVISAYAKKCDGFRALEAYRSMLRLGVEPAKYAFVCLFKACAAMGSLVEGKELHDHARRNGFCSDAYIGASLMDMYSKCGDLVEAENVFCALPQRDAVTWNVMLFAQLRHNRAFKAMMLYRQMQEEGCGPNHLTFIALLQACDLLADGRKHCTSHELAGKVLGLEIGTALHADAYKKPLCRSNPLLRNTLMAMYAKFGAI
jgi:pentatricopeptide repeat protein